MSKIQVNEIVNHFDTGAPDCPKGLTITGIVTATTADFSGNVSIGGTLTYEDVTNIDSVGIITAQSGIVIGTGSSISSPAENQLAFGTNDTEAIRINADGDVDIGSGGVFYDATNNRLGVGTTSPGEKLDVDGTANATNLTRGGSQVYSRDNIIGTVSQSSGAPTGAIIESGSNANGEYVRYADGTQMTTTRTQFDFSGFTNFDVTLPVSFNATEEYHVSVCRAQGGSVLNTDAKIGCYSNNANSARFQLPVADASSGTFYCVVFCVGRWY